MTAGALPRLDWTCWLTAVLENIWFFDEKLKVQACGHKNLKRTPNMGKKHPQPVHLTTRKQLK